jgi:septal ring factor EnvC (AmiA/AmiB activator)
MTTETCVGIDIKLTHNWSEGRKKGEADAQEEFRKRFDKGDTLQDELNKEIKNSKLERMLLTDQIVKVEDEVVKLNKKIKEFDFIKEKLDIDIKDMELNGKNMEKKLETTEKEMKRLIEVNRRYANDAQRLLVFGEDTIKKFVDDNWFNERIEKRRDKDVFKCIKNC